MTWTSIRPIGTRILVRLHEKRVMYGHLEMPDDYRKQPETGEIFAVGPRAPRELAVGDIVYCGKYNGVGIPAPDHDPAGVYRMLEARHDKPMPHVPDVYGILEPEPGKPLGAELLRVGTDVSKAIL